MKLYEEFKEYENMWEDNTTSDDDIITLKIGTLTEGFFEDLRNRMLVHLLKLCNKFAPKSATFDACLSFLEYLDLGDLTKAPYYFTKEKVASMMQADIKRLSAKEWYDKWWDLLINGTGNIQFNPKDYPDINFNIEALKAYNNDHITQ